MSSASGVVIASAEPVVEGGDYFPRNLVPVQPSPRRSRQSFSGASQAATWGVGAAVDEASVRIDGTVVPKRGGLLLIKWDQVIRRKQARTDSRGSERFIRSSL